MPFRSRWCHLDPLPSHSPLLLPPARWLLETMLSLEPRLLLFAKQLSPALRKRDFCAGKEKGKRHGLCIPGMAPQEVSASPCGSAGPTAAVHISGIPPKLCCPQGAANPQAAGPVPRHPMKGTVLWLPSSRVSPGAASD